jgi:integrase/recombinase XerD
MSPADSPPPSPLIQASSDFIDHGRSRGWTDRTVASYRHLFTLAVPLLISRGCALPADVTPADLDAVMTSVRDAGRAKKTRVQLAILLKQFFGWLHAHGRVIVDVSLAVGMPDDGEEDLLEPPLTEAEVRALFDALPRRSVFDLRNACLLELLYGCGLRIGEAIRLTVNDIDLARRVVRLLASKHGQDRVVPLMGTAQAAVQDYLAVRRTLLKGPDHGALLLSQYGKRLKQGSIYGFFEDLNRQRGSGMRHLHPHLLRHSIAVHLLQHGADVRYIQQFLGHGSLDTTKIYLRLVPGRLKEDYDRAMPEINVGMMWEHMDP